MENLNNRLSNTPCFASSLYGQLPEFLKNITQLFDTPRERDMVLLSSLVTIGGCWSKMKALYDKDWIHPNLFLFVVAPPASNKAKMKYSKSLGDEIQESYLTMHDLFKSGHANRLRIYNAVAKSNPHTTMAPPEKPPLPVLFIPGNSSSTKIYQLLNDSDGSGIIFETEADTITSAIKQKWGEFKDLLRSSFHHEVLSLSRMGDDKTLYIKRPRLSLVLSGTPDQVPKLISSTQDGLMSRIMFYVFSADVKWRSPRPCADSPDLQEYFEKLSIKVAKVKNLMDTHKYSFKFTTSQHDEHDNFFEKNLERITKLEGRDAVSPVLRMGMIAFRMAMILTVIRKIEDFPELDREFVCDDRDFETTMQMMETLLEHSMTMYELLPSQETRMPSGLRRLYNLLPVNQTITTMAADLLGKSIEICKKTVYNYLQRLKSLGLIVDDGTGQYKRISD